MADPTTFRDSVGRLGSPWTQNKWGARFKYCAGILIDAVTDALRDGVKARFPGVGTAEALPYIGNDRQIIRGFNETDESYAARLSGAFDAWKHAGSAPAVAKQLLAYVAPATPRIRIVSTTYSPGFGDLITTWVTLESGAVTFLQVEPGNWDWDGMWNLDGFHTTYWSRFWVIIYTGAFPVGGTWGDGGLWGDGRVWGTGATTEQIGTLRKIIQQWKGSHSQCGADIDGGGIIFPNDDSMFDPTSPPGAPMPDGTWGSPANRDPDASYIPGF